MGFALPITLLSAAPSTIRLPSKSFSLIAPGRMVPTTGPASATPSFKVQELVDALYPSKSSTSYRPSDRYPMICPTAPPSATAKSFPISVDAQAVAHPKSSISPKLMISVLLNPMLPLRPRVKFFLFTAYQFRVTSNPRFSFSPMFRYWLSYPVPCTGNRINRSLVEFLYASSVPLNLPLKVVKSNPRLRVTVVSHFKLGFAIILEGAQ